MKKTLFAMLALATMMPAIAFAEMGNLIVSGNWKFAEAWVNLYENFTDYTKYSLYLTVQENTDITSVKTMLEGKTFSEFTTTIASGDGIAFEDYDHRYNQLSMRPYAGTEFPTTLTPQGNIWGVCVLQDTDVVRFQVLQVSDAYPNAGEFYYDTDYIPGSGYTSFKADSPVVPEPATATLSLLALAGLASRRKRK